jgi:hypothetical protein
MTEANGAGNGSEQATEQNGGSGGWTPPSSQEEFDRIIADRVARTKNQYKDYNDLKRKAGEYDREEESRKSDLQKAQDREKAADDRAAAAVDRAVRAEVRAIATGEFADPTDAHLYLGDLSRFVDDKGDIDSKAIESALQEVEKSKPHLRAAARTDVGIGPRGNSTASDMNTLIRAGRGR